MGQSGLYCAVHKTANPDSIKALLRELYLNALEPALPEIAMAGTKWPEVSGRTYLLSVGKAATQMAAAIDGRLPRNIKGQVVTRQGYRQIGYAPNALSVVEASHPVPSGEGAQAAQSVLAEVDRLSEEDLLLVLMSGGASSLLPAPAGELKLEDKQAITRDLLHCGAPIGEMNIVRKHLSAIKGGHLAARAWPAQTHMIAISDIPGDDVSMIGSGPTITDRSTCDDAMEIVDRYDLSIPSEVRRQLQSGTLETPKPGHSKMDRSSFEICARAADICEAAANFVTREGYEPIMLGDDLEGDAIALGEEHAKMAMQIGAEGRKAAIISGGEATVTVSNPNGRGGRCTSYMLAFALALEGSDNIVGFAADTDGIDGTEDNAGAFLWPGIVDQMGGRESAQRLLDADNSYIAFEKANGLLITGPSGTNVNDLRVLLIDQ